MWPNMNTTLSSRACCTVILHAKKNVLPWKQIHMKAVLAVPRRRSEAYPAVRGSHLCDVSPSTFLMARWCHSPSLLLVKALGIYIHLECKPSWLWQCAFFFFSSSSRKYDSSLSSAKEGRVKAGVKVRIRATSETFLPRLFFLLWASPMSKPPQVADWQSAA